MATVNDEREVRGGRRRMGRNEQIAWDVVTTAWGSDPETPACALWDVTGGEWVDVSTSNLSGAASVAGDVITTPYVYDLTPGHLYRLEVQFVISGNVLEAYAEIQAEQ